MEHREVAEHSPDGPRVVELAMDRQRLLEKTAGLVQVAQIEMKGRQVRQGHPLTTSIASGAMNHECFLTKGPGLHDLPRIPSDDAQRLECLAFGVTMRKTLRFDQGLTQLVDCFGHTTLDVERVAGKLDPCCDALGR